MLAKVGALWENDPAVPACLIMTPQSPSENVQPGAYFITIVARRRECLFGKIQKDEMQMNSAGQIIWDVWNSLPGRYPQNELGAAQGMPNHFPGILIIPVRAIQGTSNFQELVEPPAR